MPDFICHACNQKKSQSQVQECDKCHKILCDSCRGGASSCKDSPKGQAGCSGHFKHR
jgi:hypothetical protein